MTRLHITVIAKAPQPGSVKTRLCPPCTFEEAAQVAQAALDDTLDAVDAVVATATATTGRVRRALLLEGPRGSWVREGYEVVAQRGDGLGARLANGFTDLGPGVIISMDSPAAVPSLADALSQLADGTDVLGPAADGGYWCIGLARTDPSVFDGVPMSVPWTGMAQLRRMHALGRPVHLLPMEYDLDTAADLVRATHDGRAPRLRRAAQALLRDA